MKDPFPGHFYREQLTPAPEPNYKTNFFEVEKILEKKQFKKKTFYLGKIPNFTTYFFLKCIENEIVAIEIR